MKTILTWLKNQSKSMYIIAGIAVIVLILLSITKCNSKKQQNESITIAVLQHENATLLSNNASLEVTLKSYKDIEKKLQESINEKDNTIVQLDRKVSVIASNYATEVARVKTLSNDDVADLFLKESGCKNISIIKYDSSYIIPPCPLRTYVNIKMECDMQKSTNLILKDKIGTQLAKINDLYSIIGERGNQIIILDSINKGHKQIETNMNVALKEQYKMYRVQRRKTWFIGIGEAVLFGGVLYLLK